MSTPPAGWHPDPSRRHEHRFWDGTKWTEHVSDAGKAGIDPLHRPPTQDETPKTSAEEPRLAVTFASPSFRSSTKEKITAFNAKRIATELQDEIARLEHVMGQFGLLDAAALQKHVDQQRVVATQLEDKVKQLTQEVSRLESQVISLRDRISLEEVGLFDFEHAAEASQNLAAQLESVRARIRESSKIGVAITATTGFTFNNSESKGKTFVNQMSRIMLRAYNAEAENAVKTVRAGNLAAAQKRLETARAQIAKQGQMIDLSVSDYYHHLRSDELRLASEHLRAVEAAKQLERERRADLREQRILEAEIRKEKERLDKERAHYMNAIQRLLESGDESGAAALRKDLDRIDEEIQMADYRAANIRAGYVYVISNIGAFGEGVVKIGMTRRLEPMDRVRELGDASVPFQFDVHALFFSDDAFSIEAMLHREFAEQRLNKVNTRREFFHVTPQQVLDVLNEKNVSVLEFRKHAIAEDFRMSWPDGYPSD